MFLKNRNSSSKIKRSKVTDYAALSVWMVAMVSFLGLNTIQYLQWEGIVFLHKMGSQILVKAYNEFIIFFINMTNLAQNTARLHMFLTPFYPTSGFVYNCETEN